MKEDTEKLIKDTIKSLILTKKLMKHDDYMLITEEYDLVEKTLAKWESILNKGEK